MNSASLHLSGVHPFVDPKDVVLLVSSVFLVGLDDEVSYSGSGLKQSI